MVIKIKALGRFSHPTVLAQSRKFRALYSHFLARYFDYWRCIKVLSQAFIAPPTNMEKARDARNLPDLMFGFTFTSKGTYIEGQVSTWQYPFLPWAMWGVWIELCLPPYQINHMIAFVDTKGSSQNVKISRDLFAHVGCKPRGQSVCPILLHPLKPHPKIKIFPEEMHQVPGSVNQLQQAVI